MIRTGLKPATSGFQIRRLNHSVSLPACQAVKVRSENFLRIFSWCCRRFSGSMPPDSHSIFEEGAVFKSFKIVKGGVFQEEGKQDIATLFTGCSWLKKNLLLLNYTEWRTHQVHVSQFWRYLRLGFLWPVSLVLFFVMLQHWLKSWWIPASIPDVVALVISMTTSLISKPRWQLIIRYTVLIRLSVE